MTLEEVEMEYMEACGEERPITLDTWWLHLRDLCARHPEHAGDLFDFSIEYVPLENALARTTMDDLPSDVGRRGCERALAQFREELARAHS